MSEKELLQEVVAEIQREQALRDGVYPKWIEAGKLTQELADKRKALFTRAIAILGWISQDPDGIKKAVKIAKWVEKVGGDRIKLALKLLADVESNPGAIAAIYNDAGQAREAPGAIAAIYNDAALKELAKQFPDAQLIGIKDTGEQVAEAA